MACLVRELRGQEHRHLGIGRMDARQEARRHVERRELVLGQEAHHLRHRVLEQRRQTADLLPGNVAGVPLRADGLVVELGDLLRSDAVALDESERVGGAARLHARVARREPGVRVGTLGERPRRARRRRTGRREVAPLNQMAVPAVFGPHYAEVGVALHAAPRRQVFAQ